VCRPAVGPCDIAEICNGIGATCPGNAFAAEGLSCDDGLVCNGVAKCSGGACVAGTTSCDDGDVCTTDSCVEPTGCRHTRITGCDAGVPTDSGTDSSITDSGSDTLDATDSSVADSFVADSSSADAMAETTSIDSSPTDSSAPDTSDTAIATDTDPDTAITLDTATDLDSAPPVEDSMPPGDDAAIDDAGAPIEDAADSGGCGCTIPGTSRAMQSEPAVLALLLITARYRRRRASR